jgi:hypothetical protein
MSTKKRSWSCGSSWAFILLALLVVGSTASSSGVEEPAGEAATPAVSEAAGALPAFMPGEVIVALKDAPAVSLDRLESEYGLRTRGTGEGLIAASGRAARGRLRRRHVKVLETDRDVRAVCAALRDDPAVAFAQPNYIYKRCGQPNDPDFPDQYAHQLIQMPDAWDISTGSHDVLVAVLGTGVDIDHPDLEANIWTNEGEIPGNDVDDDENGYVDDVHGWNFEADSNEVDPGGASDPFDFFADVSGHETQVAGVIAAVGNNDLGVCGVNWQCRIMPLRVSLYFTSEEVAAALDYAAANGADVLNMSFGSDEFGPDGDPIVREAIDNAFAAGVLLTASAGNDDTDRPHYPAAYHNVMAVASTNGEDIKTGHSSFGSWVDIAAPGTDIVTTDLGGEYIATAGTSFSAPYVGAVAALVLAHRPELSHVELRAILENTADPVWYGIVDPAAGYVGTGRVNAYEALVAADEPMPLGEIIAPRPAQRLPADTNAVDVDLFVHGGSYQLDYRRHGNPDWVALSDEGGVPDANGFVRVPFAPPGLGVYELRLSVTTGERTHTDVKTFGMEFAAAQTGWPVPDPNDESMDDYFVGSPMCLDVDGDGRNEIVEASMSWSDLWIEGKVHIWREDGTSLAGWPITLPGTLWGTGMISALAVGDIDGDGDYELIAVDDYESMVYAWHIESAQPVEGPWPMIVGDWFGFIVAQPVLADLDGDGDSEIIVALDAESMDSDGLHAIQGDGSYLWQRRYTSEGPVSVADVDLDGDVEIALCGYGPGITRVYTFLLDHQGQLIKKWRGGSPKGTAFADLDGDGQAELVFCTDDAVMAVDAGGSTVWKTRVDDPLDTSGGLSIGDVDSDGSAEVYVTTFVEADGFEFCRFYGFDHVGQPLADRGFPKTIMGYPEQVAPLIGDVDGDGQKEVLVGVAGAPIMAWDHDGSATPGFPMFGQSVDLYCVPTLEDFDQDGDLEMMMVDGEDYRFHVLDLSAAHRPDLLDWAMARHDPQNSGWTLASPELEPVAAPAEIQPGETLELQLSASNPGNTPTQLSVGRLPEGAYFDRDGQTVLWKPTADQAFQTYTFSFLVTDGVRQKSRSVSIAVVPDAIYAADMDSDPNWTLDEGWAWGEPTGEGSWHRDPNSGYTGANVVGYALDGDYENDLDAGRYATVGPIDATGYRDLRLSFRRWLGVEAPYDRAGVEVSNDGATWVDLWTAGRSHVSDTSWQLVEYAVPPDVGDDQPALYFRWGLGPTDESVTYPGWNIDDVQLTGDPIE